MHQFPVAVTRYKDNQNSVQEVINMCSGLQNLPARPKVFIKPNIVFWSKACDFPKWGVITTSRVVEAVVKLLKEHGVEDITIGEGIVSDPDDKETPAHAFKTLGYETLRQQYGIRYVNILEEPFAKVDVGLDHQLKFNEQILQSDFVVNLPVLKTHNQSVVSLGLKNLKGCLDITSRKKCHSPDAEMDLHLHISRLADSMPPMLTLIDGIYTLERGPAFDGKMHRSNILVASPDILSADMVGTKLLGHEPKQVPHLMHAAQHRARPVDLSDIKLLGEPLESLASYHEFDFEYFQDETRELPKPLAKQGLKGIFYRKFDSTMCTYCSALNGLVLTAIRFAWQGQPWNNIEILTGKAMEPSPGMQASILLGQCMYKKNKEHPNLTRMIPVKGCPPDPQDILQALHEAGIQADPNLFQNIELLPGFFMSRYQNRPEFQETFFQVQG
ncbi:MAG: DUF362 domain-containing protein [Desulfohalobiaceae bacterium]